MYQMSFFKCDCNKLSTASVDSYRPQQIEITRLSIMHAAVSTVDLQIFCKILEMNMNKHTQHKR